MRSKIGYVCGAADAECVTIVDPAAQLAFYKKWTSTQWPILVGVTVGCAVALVLACVFVANEHRIGRRCIEDYDSSEESAEAGQEKHPDSN